MRSATAVVSVQKFDALKCSNDRMHEQMHALQRKLVNVVTENEAMRHVIDKLQCHVLGLRRQLHHAGLKPTVQLDEELLRPCPHKVSWFRANISSYLQAALSSWLVRRTLTQPGRIGHAGS